MKCLLILSAILLSQTSFAQTVLGTGCDQSSSVVQLGKSGTSVTVNFSKSKLSYSGNPFERATCNLALPVVVPEGKKLVINKLKIKESYKLGGHSKINLLVSAFFPGQRGESLSQTLGQDSGSFVFSKKVKVESDCGESTIVRFNSSLILTSEEGATQIDQAAISSIALILKFVDC